MLKEDAHQLQKLPFFLQSVEPFVIFSCSSPFLLCRLFQSIRSAALSFTLPVEHSPHCCQRELSKCKSDHVTFCPQFCIAPSSLQHTLSAQPPMHRPCVSVSVRLIRLIPHYFLYFSPSKLFAVPGTSLLHLLLCLPEIKDTFPPFSIP